MKNSKSTDSIPHYGAIAFLAPKLHRLYQAAQRAAGGDHDIRLIRSEMDSFLRLSGQLLAQNEAVDEMTHRFGDDTVPLFADETEDVKRQLLALCSENADDPFSDKLIGILHLLGKYELRLSQIMGDAIIECLRVDPAFTGTVLREIPRYIEQSMDTRLPLRIYYLRLGEYTTRDFKVIKAYCDQKISEKAKTIGKLTARLNRVTADKESTLKTEIKSLRHNVRNLQTMQAAALEALDFLGSRRKPLRHNSPVLQIFMERLEGNERSKVLYNLISSFEEEDEFLYSMGYYPGQAMETKQRQYPSSNDSSFLPHRHREGLIIPRFDEDGCVNENFPPEIVLGDILGFETITATFSTPRRKRMSSKS